MRVILPSLLSGKINIGLGPCEYGDGTLPLKLFGQGEKIFTAAQSREADQWFCRSEIIRQMFLESGPVIFPINRNDDTLIMAATIIICITDLRCFIINTPYCLFHVISIWFNTSFNLHDSLVYSL